MVPGSQYWGHYAIGSLEKWGENLMVIMLVDVLFIFFPSQLPLGRNSSVGYQKARFDCSLLSRGRLIS